MKDQVAETVPEIPGHEMQLQGGLPHPRFRNYSPARHPEDETRGTRYGRGKKYARRALNNDELRQRARETYARSTVAGNIVRRIKDTVWNTGLALESSPLWDLIPRAPSGEKERYALTRKIETLWKLTNDSKELDASGRRSGNMFQGFVGQLQFVEGEVFAVLRYKKDPRRISPVAVQILNPDQIQNPLKPEEIEAVEKRGGRIQDGIEYDADGQEIAIHVRSEKDLWNSDTTRIPFFGPKSGRRFVIHWANIEGSDQLRGISELERLFYEIGTLDDYFTAELDGANSAAKILASIEADAGTLPGQGPNLKPKISNSETRNKSVDAPEPGIEEIGVGSTSLILQTLFPGYKLKYFQHNRPNANFDGFVESLETHFAGEFGMPLSVYRQKFNQSYSAARAEILFFWMSVEARRADFIQGFLLPLFEAWFSEMVAANQIKCPGFNTSMVIKRAWLNCDFVGIARPTVDPVKEFKAVEGRLKLGHTTNEKESKIHNGSDFYENISRLGSENKAKSKAIPSETPGNSPNSGNTQNPDNPPPPDSTQQTDSGNTKQGLSVVKAGSK